MELSFSCPNCKQQLEADGSLSGSEIQCPTCGATITIPEPDPALAHSSVHSAIASSAAAKEEYHFSVPVHDEPSEVLITKSNPPLEVAAKAETEKTLQVKTIRRTDCVEVGHDRFDEVVSEYLAKVGEKNIVSISPIAYTHLDMGSRQMMTDFGVIIIYRG